MTCIVRQQLSCFSETSHHCLAAVAAARDEYGGDDGGNGDGGALLGPEVGTLLALPFLIQSNQKHSHASVAVVGQHQMAARVEKKILGAHSWLLMWMLIYTWELQTW